MTFDRADIRLPDPDRAAMVAERIAVADAMQLLLHRLIWLELKGDSGSPEWNATNAALDALRTGTPE